jgi:hypothetical protein
VNALMLQSLLRIRVGPDSPRDFAASGQ